LQSHFWVGSFCSCVFNGKPFFPRGIVAISDIITLIEDIENRIPDRSWMLYLLEIFNKKNIPSELNLICQFDNQNYFEAIFQGINQYRFKQVLPVVSHSYLRQIVLNHDSHSINYILTDITTKQSEMFDLLLDNNKKFDFEGLNQFTGIEWWNKIGNYPYPIRYHAEISQLLYGLSDAGPSNSKSIVFRPYNALIPNNEGLAKQYPISFDNPRIKEDDSCICYNILDGLCTSGLSYNL
jgi:hypothetical protein